MTKEIDCEANTVTDTATVKKDTAKTRRCCVLKVLGLVSLGLLFVGAITVGIVACVSTPLLVEAEETSVAVRPDGAFVSFTNKYATVTIEIQRDTVGSDGAAVDDSPTAPDAGVNGTGTDDDDGLEDYVKITVENGAMVRRTFRFNSTAHAAWKVHRGAAQRDTKDMPPQEERPSRKLTLVGDKDERVPVQDISPRKVYGSVVRLSSGGQAFCSGALVGPSTVVTAYHCLRNRNPSSFEVELHPTQRTHSTCTQRKAHAYVCGWTNGWFKFCLAHSEGPGPGCTWKFGVKAITTPAGHTSSTHDIALLELHDSFGVTAGKANGDTWLTLATKSDSFFTDKTVRATGYSEDKNGQMMTATGPTGGPTWRPAIHAPWPNWLNHRADIVPGNSGGPITSTDDRNPEVYAVQAQQSHPGLGSRSNPTLCGETRDGKDCYNNAGRVTETFRALAPSAPMAELKLNGNSYANSQGTYVQSGFHKVHGQPVWDREDGRRFIAYCSLSRTWRVTDSRLRDIVVNDRSNNNCYSAYLSTLPVGSPWYTWWAPSWHSSTWLGGATARRIN